MNCIYKKIFLVQGEYAINLYKQIEKETNEQNEV